jgi:hypothetical protein
MVPTVEALLSEALGFERLTMLKMFGELSTELQRVVFAEGEIAKDSGIDVFIARAVEQVTRSQALGPRRRNDEGAWIKPFGRNSSPRTMRTEDGIANDIRAVVVDAIQIDVGTGGDREGSSAM